MAKIYSMEFVCAFVFFSCEITMMYEDILYKIILLWFNLVTFHYSQKFGNFLFSNLFQEIVFLLHFLFYAFFYVSITCLYNSFKNICRQNILPSDNPFEFKKINVISITTKAIGIVISFVSFLKIPRLSFLNKSSHLFSKNLAKTKIFILKNDIN